VRIQSKSQGGEQRVKERKEKILREGKGRKKKRPIKGEIVIGRGEAPSSMKSGTRDNRAAAQKR